MTTAAFTLTVASTSLPGWWTELPEKTWTPIAVGLASGFEPNAGTYDDWQRGYRIGDVRPGGTIDPAPYGQGDLPLGLRKSLSWSSGCVDTDRGELIFAANGGHADYDGNEVYALSLREDQPTWRRIYDPTPADPPDYINAATFWGDWTLEEQVYLDGRPSADHGWFNQHYADGYVWKIGQRSTRGGGGGITSVIHRWNRAALISNPSLKVWSDDVGLWENYGPYSTSTDGSGSNSSVYIGDSQFIKFPSELGTFIHCDCRVKPHIATTYVHGETTAWSSQRMTGIYAPDIVGPSGRGIAIFPAGDRYQVMVIDTGTMAVLAVKTIATTIDWAPTGTTTRLGSGWGAVYHPPSKAILYFHQYVSSDSIAIGYSCPTDFASTGKVRVMRIPHSNGVFNVGGDFTVEDVAPASAADVPVWKYGTSDAWRGMYGKFNIVPMGGDYALIVTNQIYGKSWVYKLPAGGV